MIVDYLKLSGFLGYYDACELDFRGRGTIGIVGDNESGKSSILRAITYALFGQVPTPQGLVREVQLINDDSDDLMIELVATLSGGNQLHIERGRTKKNEPILRASGIGTAPATRVQQHISDTVQMAYEDFITLSYFVQGDLHQFMSGSKRAYFQRWTEGLRLWQGYESHAGAEIAALGTSLEKARQKLEAAEERIEQEEDVKAEARSARSEALDAERRAEIIDEQVKELTAQLSASEAAGELKETHDTLRQVLKSQAAEASRIRNQLITVRRELSQIRSGICPLLPDDLECDELKRHSEAKRKEVNLKLRELRQHSRALEERTEETQRKFEGIRRKLAKSLEPTDKIKGELAQAKRDLNQSNRDLRSAIDRKARAEHSKELVEQAKDEVGCIKDEMSQLEETQRRWQFIRFMCGKAGVPAQLIEGELERVQERCNWVLERLRYSKRIKFRGYKELAGYERVCGVCGGERWRSKQCKDCGADQMRKRREEPTVNIVDGQNERPFALESGGAQVLQSFSVRLAVALFAANMTGIPIEMVMLDEVFGMLDSDNRQRLMSLVVDKLATEFGLQQQFVVSHQADVINVVDDMLLVERKRGSSTAVWR
jgi:DNA repair exonuclease SbcCD ATPase subunit